MTDNHWWYHIKTLEQTFSVKKALTRDICTHSREHQLFMTKCCRSPKFSKKNLQSCLRHFLPTLQVWYHLYDFTIYSCMCEPFFKKLQRGTSPPTHIWWKFVASFCRTTNLCSTTSPFRFCPSNNLTTMKPFGCQLDCNLYELPYTTCTLLYEDGSIHGIIKLIL